MYDKIKEIAKIKLNQSTKQEDIDRYTLINKILEDKSNLKLMKTKTAYNLLSDLGLDELTVKDIYNEIFFEELD